MKFLLLEAAFKHWHIGKLSADYGEPDFHIRLKGGEHDVGKVSNDAAPSHVPVHIMDHRIHGPYAKYAMDHAHASGFFHKRAHGTTRLKNIRHADIHAALNKFLLNKEEGVDRSGYKIHQITTHAMAHAPGRKSTEYKFKHASGDGYVEITHGKTPHNGGESNISFDVHHNEWNPPPDHKNAHRIIKTVAKAVRHHLAKEKPTHIGYMATTDQHDRPRDDDHGGPSNRRDAIYQKMIRKTLGSKWKMDTDASYSNRKHFRKVEN